MLVRTPADSPQNRICASAWVRRWALGECARTGRVSATQSPPQSPYTPLVDPYTPLRGWLRRRSARTRFLVRGSAEASDDGGAKWMIRVARPANRRRLGASSKFPCNGVNPWPRKNSLRSAWEVSANSLTLPCICLATRIPTSPQPTISKRSRRNLAGNAPRGVWFEGKIAHPFKI